MIRRALPNGSDATLAIGGAASALAFDVSGGIQAVTRNAAVVHAVPGSLAMVIDHGAHASAAIAANRLAVALDDGAVVIETSVRHARSARRRAAASPTFAGSVAADGA
jgi:hypothetical protein